MTHDDKCIRLEPNQDHFIIFTLPSGETIQNDKYLFLNYSKKFRGVENIYKNPIFKVNVESKVTVDSFNTFLAAIQKKYFFITEENYQDLLVLCHEFQEEELEKEIKKFKSKNPVNQLLNTIKSGSKKLSKLYNRIAKKIEHYIDTSESKLMDIQAENMVEIFKRINHDNEKNWPKIYTFAKEYVNQHKNEKKAAQVYKYINIFKLDENDITDFRCLNPHPTSITWKCFYELINGYNDLFSRLKILEEKMKDLEDKNKDKNKDMTKMHEEQNNKTVILTELKNEITPLNDNLSKISEKIKGQKKKIKKANGGFNALDNSFKELERKVMINFAQKNPFHGIFYKYLSPEYKEEDIKKFVEIKTEGETFPDFPLSNILKTDKKNIDLCFFHKLKENSHKESNYITFEFKSNKLLLLAYTIRSSFCVSSHPKKFSFYGSHDGLSWVSISDIKDATELNGMGKFKTYVCNDEQRNYYSHFKFLLKGSFSKFKDKKCVMALSAIELFGDWQNK